MILTAVEALDISGLPGLTLNPLDILLRLLCAMLIGVVIGTEREYTHRPAGMRTHMLVSLGAAVVMVTSQLIFAQYRAYGATPDPARLSAQVITGVGFLGGGTIMKEGLTIKGLTTAASIWTVACLGIAAGGGYYAVALGGMICVMITLIVFEQLQERLMKNHMAKYMFAVNCTNVVETLEVISSLATELDAKISRIRIEENGDLFQIHFKGNFTGRHSDQRIQDFLGRLSQDPNTTVVQTEDSQNV